MQVQVEETVEKLCGIETQDLANMNVSMKVRNITQVPVCRTRHGATSVLGSRQCRPRSLERHTSLRRPLRSLKANARPTCAFGKAYGKAYCRPMRGS